MSSALICLGHTKKSQVEALKGKWEQQAQLTQAPGRDGEVAEDVVHAGHTCCVDCWE